MSLYSIWTLIVSLRDEFNIGLLVVIVLASLVQVSKININPWDWFFGVIGRKLNKDVFDELKVVKKTLDDHIKDDENEKLEAKRRDILDFANACMNGRRHTQEQFKFVIKECDEYEKFIEEKHVRNGEITSAIEEVRRLYTRCLQRNSFLKPGEEFD